MSFTANTRLNYNQATPATRSSSNVTSVSDDSTGVFTITIATDYTDANYTLNGFAKPTGNTFSTVAIQYTYTKTAGAVQCRVTNHVSYQDSTDVSVNMFGTLT